MASKDTIKMISALADDINLKVFEILAESDRSDSKMAELLGTDVNVIREHVKVMEESGLVIACDEGDYTDYVIDPKKVAELTGFFELILNRCTPPKCC